jgi:hypothetical protein
MTSAGEYGRRAFELLLLPTSPRLHGDNKLAYAYLLTPHGIEEKARVTAIFFRRIETEYESLKQEMANIRQQEDGSGFEE